MALARQLNERFPYSPDATQGIDSPSDGAVWQISQSESFAEVALEESPRDSMADNPAARRTQEPMNESLLKAFDAPIVQEALVELYGSRAFGWLDPRADERHPNANRYAAVVIAKAMDDVRRGKDAHKDLASFVDAAVKQASREPSQDLQKAFDAYRRRAAILEKLAKAVPLKGLVRYVRNGIKGLLRRLGQ